MVAAIGSRPAIVARNPQAEERTPLQRVGDRIDSFGMNSIIGKTLDIGDKVAGPLGRTGMAIGLGGAATYVTVDSLKDAAKTIGRIADDIGGAIDQYGVTGGLGSQAGRIADASGDLAMATLGVMTLAKTAKAYADRTFKKAQDNVED